MSSTNYVNPLYFMVMRDGEEFGLFYEDELLYTKEGIPLRHESRDLLLLIKSHFYAAGEIAINSGKFISCSDVLPLTLLEHSVHNNGNGSSLTKKEDIDSLLLRDPLLNPADGEISIDQKALLSPVTDYLKHHNLPALEEIRSAVGNRENSDNAVNKLREQKEVRLFERLSAEQLAVIAEFNRRHNGMFILPLILALGGCTPLEYALGNAAVNRLIPSINPDSNRDDFEKAITAFRLEAQSALDFIHASRPKAVQEIEELIRKGENNDVEFKSTLRMNLHTGKKDDRMVHAVLKSIAAFLNAEGGTLLIGVADDGSISGIAEDGFPNDDKFLLALYDFIKTRLGEHAAAYVDAEIQTITVKKICVVSCKPAKKPVFYLDEDFYVRLGPGTTKMKTSEVLEYIETRFEK
jgi:hypothetical protein